MRKTSLLIVILIISLSITSCASFNSSGKNKTPKAPSAVPQEAIDYALIQAKFFHDPVNDVNSLYEHPEYFSFLITRVYSLYESEALTIKDVSENDWHKQYLIPVEFMEKASSLYLGITYKLPDAFYNESDYNYRKEENAFLFSPYSPPMFVTECTNSEVNGDGTINITIRISLIEKESALCENTYVYKIITDETWGTIYQLVSIK